MKLTYLVFLLDETGSMDLIKDDTIGGFNQFLDSLDSNIPFEITVIKWDSNHQDVFCKEAAPKDIPRLTKESYNPGAATPLIDVMFNAIKKTEEKVAGRDVQIQIVVQTDGFENASVEHTTSELHALVKEKTAKGWLFTFVGAGIDAFDSAQKYGIAAAHTLSYNRDKSVEAFHSMARSSISYAVSGKHSDAGFTDKERGDTGGHTAPSFVPEPLVDVDW